MECKVRPLLLHSDNKGVNLPETIMLHRGKGCDDCGNTGYRGRTGVHELLAMTAELRTLVSKEASVHERRHAYTHAR